MDRIIDISVPLKTGMPSWPGSPGFRHSWLRKLERGEGENLSAMTTDMHAGTHIDAPLHFLAGGAAVDEMDLQLFCGTARVIECIGKGAVSAEQLAALRVGMGTERLLIKTRNSALWQKGDFQSDYAALTPDAAELLLEHGVRLVGIDYLSVQCFNDPPQVHAILLGGGVALLEGLDLSHVSPGEYELICLPLRIAGAEAAPARAILRELR